MSDLNGNLEDQFSCVTAHIAVKAKGKNVSAFITMQAKVLKIVMLADTKIPAHLTVEPQYKKSGLLPTEEED